jgi:hypothetical protein
VRQSALIFHRFFTVPFVFGVLRRDVPVRFENGSVLAACVCW